MNTDLPYQPRLESKPRAKKNSFLQLLLALILAGVLLPGAIVLALLGIFEGAQLVLPGVSVTGAELGSLTYQQTEIQLNLNWNVRRTLTLSDGKTTWTALPVEYGLYLDPGATARAAYSQGRGSYLAELEQILLRKPQEVEPVVVFNEGMARGKLAEIAAQVKQAPVEAALQYANGQWSATPGKAGLELDVEAAVAQFSADPRLALMLGQVKLTTRPVQPAVSDLSQVALSRQALVNKPLKLRAYDPFSNETFTWTISAEALAPYLKVENPLSPTPSVSVDDKVLDDYLAKWQKDTLGSGQVFEAVQGRDQLTSYWQNGKELFAMVRNQALANKPLKLRAYDPISNETFTWTIPGEALAPYLKVEDPLSATPTAGLDGKVLDDYLAKWQKDTLGSGRVFEAVQGRDQLTSYWQNGKELFAMVRRLPTTFTVRAGDNVYSIANTVGIPYWRIEAANPGLKNSGLSAGLKLVIPSKNDLLPLPVVLNKRIVISISQQRMWTYENGKLRSQHVISTGMASSPTMAGVFQVTEHIINAYGETWDLWMPNWLTIYEAVPGFTDGIHGLPLLHNGVRLWGNVLGQPASYGCIIMSLKEAEDLYNWAANGTVVEIKN